MNKYILVDIYIQREKKRETDRHIVGEKINSKNKQIIQSDQRTNHIHINKYKIGVIFVIINIE